MIRLFSYIAISLAVINKISANNIKLLPISAFQADVNGKVVSLYTLHAGDIVMQVTNYGACIVTLWTPDRDGYYEEIVLGYEKIDHYLYAGERFLGSVVGPYANRIAGGHFTLEDKKYDLVRNNNGQTLHGGLKGLDCVVWDVVKVTDDQLILHYLHCDGEEGFPGNIDITISYTLTLNNECFIDYKATTDKMTVINLSHHSYFNLKGVGKGTILDNKLTIHANYITPVDSVLIPTGELIDVTNTPFDFRKPCIIGEMIETDDEQLNRCHGYDHNWVIDRKTLNEIELAAQIYDSMTGRTLEVWSNQPGLQFYSGNFFNNSTIGKYGVPFRFRESITFETQKFPDSPNHAEFPSTVLRPGEIYTHTCIYRFGVK